VGREPEWVVGGKKEVVVQGREREGCNEEELVADTWRRLEGKEVIGKEGTCRRKFLGENADLKELT
jgi:hypothetical protein